jgi:hypothetical protein
LIRETWKPYVEATYMEAVRAHGPGAAGSS